MIFGQGWGAVKVGGQGREQGWGQVRGRVKVRGSREGVMVGGLGIGARGAVGFSGGVEMKRKCSCYNSIPIHSIPIHSIPFQSIPLHFNPFQSMFYTCRSALS